MEQIERRMAPFWRGLNEYSESWAEHQLIAAGRGLPIPAADEIPQAESPQPLSPDSPNHSNQNLQGLMVPITSRSHSAASDTSATLSPSHPAFSNPASPSTASPPPSSPFRPRSKTLASITNSKSTPPAEILPREIQLPKDPYVNGQAIELFLYKDATDCPICFLSYPPYLNKTRCCDQLICSECFVQIKRPDPHPPEHHDDPSNPSPAEAAADAEALVSEPACCPYCQQPEFGVTYEPPPFRRGLTYANATHGLASFNSAMSSSSSINSTGTPAAALAPNTHKRRTTSISANASTVITTDRVRPDWATKLANARSHLARRSAAATALHTAAYLIGSGSSDTRSFGFRSGRLGRNRENSSPSASGAGTPSGTQEGARSVSEQLTLMRREAAESGGVRRRSRMDDLEEMMMMEAIRLSLAAEEDRKKKAEKEAAKEAKKRAKEEKKREKKERKGVYGSGASSASGSALSLSLGLGRRRGNSGASNLQREITPEDVEASNSKGKGIDRGSSNSSASSAPIDFPKPGGSSSNVPGARHLDINTLAAVSETHGASPSPTAPDKPSHLRQMSNASSPASSFMESVPGSLKNDFQHRGSSSTLDSPSASGTNLMNHSGDTPDGGDANGGAGSESMFNFQSLAAMIGKEDKDAEEDAATHIEHLGNNGESSRHASQDSNANAPLEESIATLKVGDVDISPLSSQRTTPEVMITPETPAAVGDDEGKQLGSDWHNDISRHITQ